MHTYALARSCTQALPGMNTYVIFFQTIPTHWFSRVRCMPALPPLLPLTRAPAPPPPPPPFSPAFPLLCLRRRRVSSSWPSVCGNCSKSLEIVQPRTTSSFQAYATYDLRREWVHQGQPVLSRLACASVIMRERTEMCKGCPRAPKHVLTRR